MASPGGSNGAPRGAEFQPSSSSSNSSKGTTEPTMLTIRVLREITDNFSEERTLGQSTYRKVYKGVHVNGEKIAVKFLHNYNNQAIDHEQFKQECHDLIRLKHLNIIRLVGYSYETELQPMGFQGEIFFDETPYRALCFEYMHNGSLQEHLSEECEGLDWHTRYKIIKGTCDGLKYLHEGFNEPIYHLNLKPGNILLDENMVPKLADFGVSNFFQKTEARFTHNPVETIVYMPVEYLDEHIVSEKVDIFSLGVVMTNIIAGPRGHTRMDELSHPEFLDQVRENWRKRLEATCTSSRTLEAYFQQVSICTEIGMSCMEYDRHKRPNIVDIIQKLEETETWFLKRESQTLIEKERGNMEAHISASQGAMRSLPEKLESLLSGPDYRLREAGRNEIRLLQCELQGLIDNYLMEPSEVKAPASAANCWANEVRELSYDVDDFIDELVHAGGIKKPPRLKIFQLREKLRPREWITITDEILGFRARVMQVIRWHKYYLANCEMWPSSSTSSSDLGNWPQLRPPPHPHRQQLHLVGMDKSSIKEIYGLLVNDGKPGRKVASIVGLAGVGKTTLAKELYHQLGRQYQCRAFVQASRKPDMRRLLTSILSQVRRHQLPSNWKVGKLAEELNAYLKDKTYFIIIENLLSPSMWNVFSFALPKDGCCSRILTTTEIDVVAQICCAGNSKHIYKKEPLSEDESRQLFSSTLVDRQSKFPEHPNNVLYEIISRCGGLPLAIVAMASVLACQPVSIEQCNYLRNSLDLGLSTNPNLQGVKQVLNLGYNSLPHCLKACILYLSLYEEDCIIWKDDLMKQWIAEGFIYAVEGDTNREEIAGSYFDELVNRGMIQAEDINCSDEVLSCTVHHIVHQFIRDKSVEENFSIIIDDSQTTIRHVEKVRRLGLHFGTAEDATLPVIMRLSRVRTLAFSGLLKCMPSILKFRFLQVLTLKLWFDPGDMVSDNLTEPDGVSFNLTGISALFRLKYLSIGASQSHVSVDLPTQMQQLKELVALEIQAKLTAAVPSDTFDLLSLVYLRLPSEVPLPAGIGRLTSLRTLGHFNLSTNSADNVINIGKLTNLRELHLTCCMVQSENLKNNMKLLVSVLGELRNLKCLTLAPAAGSSRVDTPNGADASSASISFDVFTIVSPPLALVERLELSRRCSIFSSLPEQTNKLAKLRILKIAVGKLLTHDIDVLGGLSALTALSLYIQAAYAERIVFSMVGFSVLRYFKFRCSVPLVKFEAGAMPNLQKLKLGFNAPVVDQHSGAHISIEHLSSLVEISAKIRGAGADVESTLTTALSNHPSNPSINIDLVDCTIFSEENISMGTTGKEPIAPGLQVPILEVENQHECSTQVEDKGEDENTSAVSGTHGSGGGSKSNRPMTDAAGCVLKLILNLVVAIRVAANTAKQNKEECLEMASCMSWLGGTLSPLDDGNGGVREKHPAVTHALETLHLALCRALQAVMDCQEDGVMACHLNLNAGRVSIELREVQQTMDRIMQVILVTTNERMRRLRAQRSKPHTTLHLLPQIKDQLMLKAKKPSSTGGRVPIEDKNISLLPNVPSRTDQQSKDH